MRSILVGYDRSESARHALERAAALAEAFGSRLIVASVSRHVVSADRASGALEAPSFEMSPSQMIRVDPHPTLDPVLVPGGGRDPIDPAEAELEHARHLLEERGIHAEFIPAHGKPAEALLAIARERGVDLVVVGSHEPQLLDRLLGRGVSGEVSRRAPCDVLLVR